MGRGRSGVGAIGWILVAIGLSLLLVVGYQLWGTGIETARSQSRLRDEFAQLGEGADGVAPVATGDTAPATPTPAVEPPTPTPTRPTPATTATTPAPGVGDAVARLVIPRIGLDWIVVEGAGAEQLADGPGHFADTPMPGRLGNSAIAGHRTTHGSPFGDLDLLQPGDEIEITLAGTRVVYVVTGSEIVRPSDYHVVSDSDPTRATLTLVTCHPKWSTSERLVVHADLDSTRSAAVSDEIVAGVEGTLRPAQEVR